ncbi:MAG TPA: magnesium transporter CorA family protein [Acetobacteraceae bacterium]|nr:magnesium transporter CorA family protein [Acetobacteraceae bacterium]
MLYLNTGTGPRHTWTDHEAPLHNAVWLDLKNPTDEERAAAERATGLMVPSKADLAEVESSSRLGREGDTLYLSMPMSYRGPDGMSATAPLGFVLSPRHLLTIRFSDLPAFDTFAERFATGSEKGSCGAFIGLLEAIVDRLADALEHVGGELDATSRRVFGPHNARGNMAKMDLELRETLQAVGQAGERLSKIRDSLLGLQRIALYVHDVAADWLPKELAPRLLTARQDIASLADYDTQLSNKVQFLLDATLGFINIEQNNGIKVLTVVSVVGVPPTLVASMYGMNFKNIGEYDWAYGYQWGLTLIVLSAVLPLLWFKRKGWI